MSVLIPTFQRPRLIQECVRRLARQMTEAPYEVLVGFDGADADGAAACERAWREALPEDRRASRTLVVHQYAKLGYMHAREQLVAAARGELLLNLNDDVRPEPTLIGEHLRSHDAARRRGVSSSIVVGYSPFVRRAPGDAETLADRLVASTSIVFFYDAMLAPDGTPRRGADHDWGFRHCFGLNFSAPAEHIRAVGGFTTIRDAYGYDDIELGFKLAKRFNAPVLFNPSARADHEHFYSAADLVRRERRLGQAAWGFCGVNPDFGRATFGRDIQKAAELAYAREYVQREARDAERIRERFLLLDRLPASTIDGAGEAAARDVARVLEQQWVLLKRWEWRSGLVEAADRDG